MDKVVASPARAIAEWKKGMPWGDLKSPNAAAGCCSAGMNAGKTDWK